MTENQNKISIPVLALGKCSVCKSATDTTTAPADLRETLNEIKRGAWKESIERFRAESTGKEFLPMICVCGQYEATRSDSNLVSRSGFLALDYDKKTNPDVDFEILRESLTTLPFILAVFTSASGSGLKAIVRIPDDIDFSAAIQLCAKTLAPLNANLDTSSGAYRHTFVSFDENAYINPNPEAEIPAISQLKNASLDVLMGLFTSTRFAYGRDGYFDVSLGDIGREIPEKFLKREFNLFKCPKEQCEQILYRLQKEKFLSRVFPAKNGYAKGVYSDKSTRFFVQESPGLLHPQKHGSFQNVDDMFRRMFDDPCNPRQIDFVFTWMKNFRARLRKTVEAHKNGIPVPNQKTPAVCIVGDQATGKSTVVKYIAKLFGGRMTSGAQILRNIESRFTGQLSECEVLLLDDVLAPTKNVKSAQEEYLNKVKEVAFSGSVKIEKKGKDEEAISDGCWAIIQLLNPANIQATPKRESDKIVFFKAGTFSDVFNGFNQTDFDKLNNRIEEELESFAYWLDNEYSPPPEVLPCGKETENRIGMRAYTHPEIERLIVASELEQNIEVEMLLEKIDAVFSIDPSLYGEKITATEICNRIYFDGNAQKLSQLLIEAKKSSPDRVTQIVSGNKSRGWVILAPKTT